MQHPSPRSPRICDEPEDRPATRRKIVGACLLAAVAVHGAVAFAPLNFGGSPTEYGIAPGSQIEVTLMIEPDNFASATEPVAAAVPSQQPEVELPVAELQPTIAEEPIADAPQAAPPPVAPIQPQRQTAAKPVTSSTPSARTAGAGQRTTAKPDYLRNPPPKYPAESRKLREEGVVLLKVSVTAAGSAADVQLQRSCGYARLDQAALRAVRRWEFKPARVGLTAVACVVEVPVRFGLN